MNFFRSLFGGGSAARKAPPQVIEPTLERPREPLPADVLTLDRNDRVVSLPLRHTQHQQTPDSAQADPGFAEAPAPAPQPATEEPAAVANAEAAERVVTLEPGPAVDLPQPGPAGADDDDLQILSQKSVQRPKARKSKVKTRLLGFEAEPETPAASEEDETSAVPAKIKCPVGWLVVTDGPGTGEWFTLAGGLASIGRGEEQTVRLDFGDMAISRANHAALAFDTTDQEFLLGDGGKANSVKVNGVPVAGTQRLKDGDIIGIGETTLRLVALCNADFNWKASTKGGANDVESA